MGRQIAILGAGPGGYAAAVRAAQNGAEVTVVEKARVGGTCLNCGCIPSKIMKVTAEMMENLHRAESFGIHGVNGFSVDMPALMSRQEKIVDTQAKGIEKLLSHHNIDLVIGDGYIQGQGMLTVHQTGGQVKAVDTTSNPATVTLAPSPLAKKPGNREKKPSTVAADKVLVCIGRSPNTSAMGLENIGVALDHRGWIVADDKMQTRNPDVFAIGDVLGPDKVMLAHVASAEGLVAADNATGNDRRMDYRTIPSAIFTMPEVATVGLTESQAIQQGIDARADSVLFRSLGKAQAMGDLAGEAKIISDAQTGKVLGVHLIGPHATDLIAEGTLAIQAGLTTHDLTKTIHAHPTLAEAMFEVSLKSIDQALHG